MCQAFSLALLLLIVLSSCKKEEIPKDELALAKSGIQAIYMERLYVGSVGWPESDLYLSCDELIRKNISILDTINPGGATRISIPCDVLNEIVDSVNAMDSIQDFSGHYDRLWVFHQYGISDTGIFERTKQIPFKIGKAKLWWMMDYIFARAPQSFMTGKKGANPFPPRQAPPDSAWLDTVKRGLF